MEEWLLLLNQSPVLWTLFVGAIGLVLIDYVFPVDWPAYVGYALFAVFIGATVPVSVAYSCFAMLAVFSLMLTLHKSVFSRYLTNAPRYERARAVADESSNRPIDENGADIVVNVSDAQTVSVKSEEADYVVR